MSTPAPRAVPAPTFALGTDPAASPVMDMLSHHLPLTLLLDLALGVRSREVYDAEPPDLSWLSAGAVSRAS
jgi:hypothetical protein